MGDIYEAKCGTCGYLADDLEDGTGLTGTFLEPMVCGQCRAVVNVVTADLYSELDATVNACPRCGGRRLTALPKLGYDNPDAANGYRLGREANCPRCKGTLSITPTGKWG